MSELREILKRYVPMQYVNPLFLVKRAEQEIKQHYLALLPKELEEGLQGNTRRDYHQEGFRCGHNRTIAEIRKKIQED